MKYIGQHLYDLISRFRGDVYINQDLYIEQANNVAGGFSGNSTDHRILYLTGSSGKVDYSGDFEYDSTNERLTIGDIDNGFAYVARTPRVLGESNGLGGHLALHAGKSTGSAKGGSVELGTSAAGSSGTAVNSITEKLILWPANSSSGFAGSGSGSLTDYVQVTMPGALGIYADTSGDLGSNPHIVFGPRTDTANSRNQKLSEIETKGNNSAQELTSYSRIRTSTGPDLDEGNNDDTDEHAAFQIDIATSNGTTSALRNAFAATGHEGNNDVDVTLGYGATSVTAVAGDLTITGSDFTFDSVALTAIQTSGETFVDNDTSLMTSAAIEDRFASVGTAVDLTSEVSGILPVANGGTGASSLADNSILTGTGTSAVTAEANLTWDASMLTVSSTGDAGEPIIKIHQTQDAVPTTGGELRFDTDRGAGQVGNANDVLGTITWRGHDAQTGGNADEVIYASIIGSLQDPTNNGEDGKLEFNVLNQNVSNTGLLLSPSGTNGHVNATIGKGTVGIVTIEGSLNLGGHSVNDIDITSEASDANDHLMTALAIKNRIQDSHTGNSAVTLTTAAQPNITTMTGFLGGTANALVTDDGDGTITSESTLTYDSETLTIGADDDGVAIIKRKPHSDGQGGQLRIVGGNATAGQTDTAGNGLRLFGGQGTGTGVGGHVEINTFPPAASTGTTLNGSANTWDFGDDGLTTIPGALTTGTTAAMTNAGLLSVAAQTNITSLGTLTALNVDNININGDTITASGDMRLVATGNDIAVDTDNFTIESSGSVKPNFTLKATVDSNKPAVIEFLKDKGSAGADGDNIGDIYYKSDNDAQETTTFVHAQGIARLAADGAEEGQYQIKVKNTSHASNTQNGVLIASNGAVNDVTLGHGATSLTTIAGNLTAVNGVVSIESSVLDAQIKSTGNLNFVIDSDTNETGQSFGFFANQLHGSNKIMSLAEDATLQVGDGFASGTVNIYNEVDDANSGELKFQTQRGGTAADAQDDDTIGKISFHGVDDGTPSVQQYGEVTCIASDVTSGQEAGAMIFKVAEFDGTVTQGMKLEGNTDANGEVDVNIAAGAASTTTVAGNMVVTTRLTASNQFSIGGHVVDDIDLAGEFVDSDNHLMTSAAIDDRIAAAGGGVSVADSNTDTAFPVVFHDESNNLLDDTSGLTYNPNSGNLVVPGSVTAKTYQSWPCSFFDDPGTAKIYLPFSSQSASEVASDGNTFTDMVAPCNIKIHEVMLKLPVSTTGSGDITIGIETSDISASPISKSVIETETVTIASSNDNDIVHFMFDTATHATRGQNVAVTFQSDTDLSGNQNWYVNVIVEFDWGTKYSGSSAIQTS